MLNRRYECDRFSVYRYRGGADVSDQRVRLQPTKLEGRSLMADSRRGSDRAADLHGQAGGKFIEVTDPNGLQRKESAYRPGFL